MGEEFPISISVCLFWGNEMNQSYLLNLDTVCKQFLRDRFWIYRENYQRVDEPPRKEICYFKKSSDLISFEFHRQSRVKRKENIGKDTNSF